MTEQLPIDPFPGLLVVLILLAAVVASSLVVRVSRMWLPLPVMQIALGALLAAVADVRVTLAPELFLLLFVAPLLFLDSWRIPREGLARDHWTILTLAFGLVVVTVVGAGYFIHWLIPAMPLAVAFALSAVLSPTDAVSLGAIAERLPVPRRLLHVLEGESLFKDASGLVCFRFAVAAAVTGSFSLGAALASFVWLAAGGVAAGIVVTLVANGLKDATARHFGEDTGAQILVSLLIPFAAYIAADAIASSGILAVNRHGILPPDRRRSLTPAGRGAGPARRSGAGGGDGPGPAPVRREGWVRRGS